MRYGGSFAPPVSDETLATYDNLAADAPTPIGDAMRRLLTMLRKFRETPASTAPSAPHRSGVGVVRQLETAEKERVADVVPQRDELEMFAARFDTLDPMHNKALRDAAFHLLWFACELKLGREPCTNDML